MVDEYIPDRGDIIWLDLNPQAGHEQFGRCPVLVLSPIAYNKKVGMALMCPVTKQIKGYPFEVEIPTGLTVTGAILSDQVKCLDLQARRSEFMCKLPSQVTAEVLGKLNTLIRI